MTSKLYDELYPKIHFLNQLEEVFDQFFESWWKKKCLNYDGNQLSDYYDLFFSRFVTFNALYDSLIKLCEKLGMLEPKRNKKSEVISRGEKEKALILIKILPQEVLRELLKEPSVLNRRESLIQLLEARMFLISDKEEDVIKSKDILILNHLKSKKNNTRFLGLLETIYHVRCNMFHGSKGFKESQKRLLEPLNSILFQIVEYSYKYFKKQINDNRNALQVEIKELENVTGNKTLQ
jgi:hypothetical protein